MCKAVPEIIEPERFGWLTTGERAVYFPSPETIRAECARIQKLWSANERYKRQTLMPKCAVVPLRDRHRVELRIYDVDADLKIG
jgi:hypothetical protein